MRLVAIFQDTQDMMAVRQEREAQHIDSFASTTTKYSLVVDCGMSRAAHSLEACGC